MKKSKIKQIISEEISRARKLEEQAIVQDELGSISPIEIEEMLNNYFKRHDIPENINKLSVLFDVLDKAGLKNLSDSYQRVIGESPDMAMEVLDHVKSALKNIRRQKGKVSVAVKDAGQKALDKMGYLDDDELQQNYGSTDRAGIVRGDHPLKETSEEEHYRTVEIKQSMEIITRELKELELMANDAEYGIYDRGLLSSLAGDLIDLRKTLQRLYSRR